MNPREILASRNGRIGLAVGGVIILVLIFMIMSSGGSGMKTIATTGDHTTAEVWQWKHDKIPAFNSSTVIEDSDNHWKLVAPAADATNLKLLLKSNADPAMISKQKKCPKGSMFASGSAKNESALCQQTFSATNLLETYPGIAGALVTIRMASSSLDSTDNDAGLSAIIFLDPTVSEPPNGADLADLLSKGVAGLQASNIKIVDNNRVSIWPDTGSGNGGTGGSAACNAPTGDAATTQDLHAKEDQLARCQESQIRAWIGDIVDDPGDVVVHVRVVLNSEAKTKSIQEYLRGEATSESHQSSDGSSSDNITRTPGYSVSTVNQPPGGVDSTHVAVTLYGVDSKHKRAVEKALSTAYSNPTDDYSVSVVDGSRKHKTSQSINKDNSGNPATSATQTLQSTKGMSKPLLAGIFLAGVALLTAIALLWRRNASLQDQRKMFEEEFRSDYNKFNQFANDNPDMLAQELENLLAMPSRNPGGER